MARGGWQRVVCSASRMNLQDMPDDVYTALAESAQANRQSLSAAPVCPSPSASPVVSALRGPRRANPTLRAPVPRALHHLADFPIRRRPLATLLQRIWELRTNLTAYDAAYVALAELLDAPLISCDGTLPGASGPRWCSICSPVPLMRDDRHPARSGSACPGKPKRSEAHPLRVERKERVGEEDRQ